MINYLLCAQFMYQLQISPPAENINGIFHGKVLHYTVLQKMFIKSLREWDNNRCECV